MNRLYESPEISKKYIKYRPTYPNKVTEVILDYARRSNLEQPFSHVVDIGCGSGQATQIYAPFSRKVTGIDPSESQISVSRLVNTHSNVTYINGKAEDIPFQNKSVDIINSATAIHWVDFPKFLLECDRVLKPSGFIALFCYDSPHILRVGSTNVSTSKDSTSDTYKLMEELDSKVLSHPAYDLCRNKYKGLFDLIPSKTKIYHVVKSREIRSLDYLYGYIQSLGEYQILMSKKSKELEQLNSKNLKDELRRYDIGLKFIEDVKDLWGIDENDNSSVEVEIEWEVFMVLSQGPFLQNPL